MPFSLVRCGVGGSPLEPIPVEIAGPMQRAPHRHLLQLPVKPSRVPSPLHSRCRSTMLRREFSKDSALSYLETPATPMRETRRSGGYSV
jgi:hypothetical protein